MIQYYVRSSNISLYNKKNQKKTTTEIRNAARNMILQTKLEIT